jgi:hypothetical protein
MIDCDSHKSQGGNMKSITARKKKLEKDFERKYNQKSEVKKQEDQKPDDKKSNWMTKDFWAPTRR